VVGIQVFDSAGKYLGRLRGARNLAFGGPDKRTLYLTAADGFFRVKMLSQGPERPQLLRTAPALSYSQCFGLGAER
jgi:sugar lactone lactonase YvrE